MIRSNYLLSLPTSRQNWLVSVKKVPHCTHLVLSVLCFFRHPVCTLHSAVFPIKTFCTCHKIINIKTIVSSHLWPWKYSTFPGYSMTAANIFEDIGSTLLQIKILRTDKTADITSYNATHYRYPWVSQVITSVSKYTSSRVVSVAVAVPLASWGTTAATRVPRLRIGERPEEWTRG